MKKTMIAVFIALSVAGSGYAEIKKAHIPNTNLTPGLRSLMKKNDRGDEKRGKINTNGEVVDENRGIIVDDIEEPKCIFYGNYNDGSGDSEQYFDIDTIVFECE